MSRGSIPKDPGLLYGAPPKRPRKPRLQRTEQGDGTIIWRVGVFGVRHREDGPAAEWEDGRREWWLEGEQVSLARGHGGPGAGLASRASMTSSLMVVACAAE